MNIILQNIKWQVLILAGIIFLLYARTLNYEFIGLDEQSLLVEKKTFNEKFSNIPKAFLQHVFQSENYLESAGSKKFYRPLLTVSFIIDQQFLKNSFTFFRFTNILIHFIAVIGLLFVLLQLKIPSPISFFLSLLFAVHPLLIQAIAWVPGRNDSLGCAFVLWSFYFLLKYFQSQSQKNLFLHLLFFTGALFTKENAVMFSIPCTIFLFFIQGKNLVLNKKLILPTYYIILICFWIFIRNSALGEIKTRATGMELYFSFLKNFPLVLQYFQKTILPVNLSVMASVDDTNYGLVLAAFLLFGTGIYFTKHIPWAKILFGLCWFFLFLLPTLLFSYFEGMEHRTYLPAIGILISISFLEPIQNLSKNLKLTSLIFGMIILIFGTITFFRLPVFSNELTYWKNANETSEHSAVVCRDYGIILTKLGNYSEAEKVYLEGIRRNPKEILIHYNLGVMYFRAGKSEAAKENLEKEFEINPANFMIPHVLGMIYKQEMKMNDAATMWEKAIALNPKSTDSYTELLKYYSQKKDTINFLRCKNELEKQGFKIVKQQ
ncbi:MAG: tetratricopeptide repeat protein [Bacteroidetes bacterium]|nr:tetratricopeptide repeat protein [Bacteroidota bacterium]